MNLQQLTDTINNIFYNNSSSYRVIESKQKELLSIIGANTNIKKIDSRVINKYLKTLRQRGNKSTTINAKMAYLSKALNYAYQNNLIDFKPYTPTLKITAEKDKYLTQDEIIQMQDYCTANNLIDLYKVILIGINTGMRISNILSLIPEDIEQGYIRIYHNKTNKPYSIPINNNISDLLTDYNPIKLNYRQIEYQFKTMINKLNLDSSITIHTLRHTFCSVLIQKGIPITTIQKLANHKNLSTTQRYSHLSNKELEEAVSVL